LPDALPPLEAPPDDPVVERCPPDCPPCWLLPDDAPDRSLLPPVDERVVVDEPVVVSRERTLPRTLISLDGRRLMVVRLDSPRTTTPGRRWRRITVVSLSGSLAT
jgi:hypothetical protein